MKKIAALALAAVATLAIANRDVALVDLPSLAVLEEAQGPAAETTKAVFSSINRGALSVLPVAATLRAENLVAAAVLRAAPTDAVAAR